jgi:hypothetical protein
MLEPRICPPVGTGRENGISAVEEQLDAKQWKRLPAIHCVANQSSLSFTCGPDGQTRKVKYEKFRQPCGIQPATCWEALESGRLEIEETKYPVTRNQTRSHMAGEEGCPGSCRQHAWALERKTVQIRMEFLVEEDWIWWNAEKGQAATRSGRVTTVLRDGEAILENGLWVWKPGDDGPILARVGGANLPVDGGGSFHQLVKNQQQEEHRTGSATPAVQRGSVPRRLFFAALQGIAITLSSKYYQKNQRFIIFS